MTKWKLYKEDTDEKEDTFTRSKIPQIYKYYADDVTPIE